MGVLDLVSIKEAVVSPHLNTGTMFDLAVGRFEGGADNHMLLNGGLHHLTAMNGRTSTYKSTMMNSLLARILRNYPGVDAVIYDTENTLPGLQRIEQIAGIPIEDRVKLINSDSHKAADWHSLVRELGEAKLKNKKDFMVETPFIDRSTGQALRMMTPTIMFIDSWSFMRSDTEEELFEKNAQIDSSKYNMLFMADGMMKTRLMKAIPTYATKYGFYFLFTAHIGNKKDLDPYKPEPKQLQFIKGSDKIKYAGALYEFLPNIMMQTSMPKTLQDSDKGCEYPYDKNTPDLEVNIVDLILQRCKFNAGGSTVPMVFSQSQGVLDDVTNYHYLKKNDGFGLEGNAITKTCLLKPEVKFDRKTLRKTLEDDYEMHRAIEILAHLLFIQNNWMSATSSPALMMTPKKMAEKFNKSAIRGDILNSRGYWTWNKDDKRPYMSILDIMELLHKD